MSAVVDPRRAAFEARFPIALKRDELGHYLDSYTNVRWLAWCAAYDELAEQLTFKDTTNRRLQRLLAGEAQMRAAVQYLYDRLMYLCRLKEIKDLMEGGLLPKDSPEGREYAASKASAWASAREAVTKAGALLKGTANGG